MSHSDTETSSKNLPAYVQRFLDILYDKQNPYMKQEIIEEEKKKCKSPKECLATNEFSRFFDVLAHIPDLENTINTEGVIDDFCKNALNYGCEYASSKLLNPLIEALIDLNTKKIKPEFYENFPELKNGIEEELLAKYLISALNMFLGLIFLSKNRQITDKTKILLPIFLNIFRFDSLGDVNNSLITLIKKDKIFLCEELINEANRILDTEPFWKDWYNDFWTTISEQFTDNNILNDEDINKIKALHLLYTLNKLTNDDAKKEVAKLKEKYERLALLDNPTKYLNCKTKLNENQEQVYNQEKNTRISVIILLVLLMVLVASSVLTFGASTIPLVAVILSSYSSAGIIAGIVFPVTCALSAITAGFAGFFRYKAKNYEDESNQYQQKLSNLLKLCENSQSGSDSTPDTDSKIGQALGLSSELVDEPTEKKETTDSKSVFNQFKLQHNRQKPAEESKEESESESEGENAGEGETTGPRP